MGFWAAGNAALLDTAVRPGAARGIWAWAVAIALHAVFIVVLALMIRAPDFVVEPEVDTPLVVVNVPPPPPPLEVPNEGYIAAMSPRFRPRQAARVMAPHESSRTGSAAEALFRYWCENRPDTAEATGRMCPSDVIMNGLAALPDRGLLGQNDMASIGMPGYTLEEAGVQRGWRKRRPPTGQDGLAQKDASHRDDASEVFGGFPWDAKPGGH